MCFFDFLQFKNAFALGNTQNIKNRLFEICLRMTFFSWLNPAVIKQHFYILTKKGVLTWTQNLKITNPNSDSPCRDMKQTYYNQTDLRYLQTKNLCTLDTKNCCLKKNIS